MTAMRTAASCSPEVRERAVRSTLDRTGEHGSLWAAIHSIAAEIGYPAETLLCRVGQSERDRGTRVGPRIEKRNRIRALEQEKRQPRRADEILPKAFALFCPGGGRPPVEAALIDDHRGVCGIEPFRRAARRIVPSTDYARVARRADPFPA